MNPRVLIKRILPDFNHRLLLRRMIYFPADLFSPMPEMVPPRGLRFDGGSTYRDYVDLGRENLRYFVNIGGLKPVHDVLDVGCGIGRLARAFAGYLTTGSYVGFDVIWPGIHWCRENIGSRHLNFSFERFDLYSQHYNPHGRLLASEWEFPWEDNSFDFVVLGSVFTHLVEQDVKHYISEISRVLRPNGVMWATAFLLNEEVRNLVAAGKSSVDLRHPLGNSLTMDVRFPESAIGHDEAALLDWICKNSLCPQVIRGNWCGRDDAQLGSHDTVVARKSIADPNSV